MSANDEDSETTALLIRCIECGNDNWFSGLRFNMMCRYSESDFNCQDCGRTLETGDEVTHSEEDSMSDTENSEAERTDPFEHTVDESQMMDDGAADYVNEWGW